MSVFDDLINDVSLSHDVSKELLLGKCRKRYVVNARCMVIRILRDKHEYSFDHIARLLKMDRTSILYAYNREDVKAKLRKVIVPDYELGRAVVKYI